MKNLLKKLHIVSEQPDDRDANEGPALGMSSESSVGGKVSPTPSSPSVLRGEQKALTGFSAWLNSVARESLDGSDGREKGGEDFSGARAVGALSSAADAPDSLPNVESQSSRLMRPLMEEEYQIQLALALSAKEDPEAVQIERVKQISLGSCPSQYTPAEVVAYRYWVGPRTIMNGSPKLADISVYRNCMVLPFCVNSLLHFILRTIRPRHHVYYMHSRFSD